MNADGSREIPARAILGILFAVALTGLGILSLLTPVSAADMTPARDRLMNAGDWMLKTAIGIFLGFAGGRLATRSGARN